ncbi:2,3-diaminopropionate biosynthesis protein SbnA [Belliella kenyensis]|uniref:N-(2-amino-2-carboxyethyl)-L-glutamate synthase n=1 Tax=Belliella kenyensis TaxID=1472724 RepID=A0ABV8EFP4_9BACT|nr:2,3-diaminopropionate biosynthesis protein SbnA [Belliella kenyensis]MCH7401111.1 2,3-diaminopropionate biosynthesis protein SbnA [Belliella kenyensis]MDN3604108.1 2,3-diaminopropionate biosynthesis protein SbnA [Belliella kenyensis]
MLEIKESHHINRTVQCGITSFVGQTGLIRLSKLFPDKQVYGKLELMNPAGSIKDRTAKFIVEESMKHDLINKNSIVVESTSGNMGVGLAQICLYYQLRLKLVVDPFINMQTLKMLEAYGAEVEMVHVPDASGSYLSARIARVKEILEENVNAFWIEQYENPLNPITHHETFKEIEQQLGQAPDFILAATSTCGTLMGLAEGSRSDEHHVKVIPVDAHGSVIFGDDPAKRLIPGFGASVPAKLLDKRLIHHPQWVHEWECIVGCKKLLRQEAILAGGSTGALVAAVEKLEMGKEEKAVIIICDRGERYLDTIYSDQWILDNLGFETFTLIKEKAYEYVEN